MRFTSHFGLSEKLIIGYRYDRNGCFVVSVLLSMVHINRCHFDRISMKSRGILLSNVFFLFGWILEADNYCSLRGEEWDMKNPKRDQTEQFRVCFFDSSFLKKTGRNQSNRE